MPLDQRTTIAKTIQADLKSYIFNNFTVNDNYKLGLDSLDLTITQEWGNGISMAIINDNWNLGVIFPPDPATPQKCKTTNQSVSGSYNVSTGQYTVTKTCAWSYS